MKRSVLLCFLLLQLTSMLFAAGKVYWTPNGVLITGIDGMGIGDFIADMRGGAYNITGDIDSVYIIRLDKDGNLPWGLLGMVVDNDNFGGAALQMDPCGVSDGKGGAIIVWDKFFPTGHELYYQRIDSLGNKMWGAAKKMTLSDSSQENHVVVSDGANGAIVAWQQYRSGQYDIYAQRIDSNGTIQWGGYGVLIATNANITQPAVVEDDKKGLLISWADESDGNWDIYTQHLDSLGNKLFGVSGIQICGADSGQFIYPMGSAADMSGGAILCWADKRGVDYDIYAQSIDSNGVIKWDINGAPVCTATGDQYEPVSVISDGAQGCIFLWGDYRSDSKGDIYSQRLDSMGNMLWQNNGVSICSYDSIQEKAIFVSDYAGGAIICWQDMRNGNSDIYSQHVDSLGNAKWQINGMSTCTASSRQEGPFIAASDSGTAVVTWADGRSGQWRAYAQRIGDDPNGVEGTPNSELQIVNCKLNQNYPNPFKQSTVIRYQVTGGGPVSLSVYNIAGQLVKTLTPPNPPPSFQNGESFSGQALEGRDQREGSVTWNGCDDTGHKVSNGVYFYRIISGEFDAIKKLVILK